LRAATERRWRELAGDGPSAEAWERFGTLIDECAFAALLKAVAGDPARPTVVRVVWAPHQWFGMDVPGSRFAGGPGADQSYAIIPTDFGTQYTIAGQWIGDRPADHNYTLAANAYFMNAINTLQMDEIDADADGRFTLTVGPEAGGRNHIRTFPGAQYLFVRDCRSDWKQSATALRVTALDPPRTAPWDDEQILVRATQIALDDAPNMFYWVRLFQGMEANRLTGPALTDDVGGLVSQTTAFARLVLSPGDVAVITAQPGDAAFHDVQLNDYWFGAVGDYVDRTGSFTGGQVAPNSDGTVTYVVAHDDPGAANWLDPQGLRETLFVARWQRLAGRPGSPAPAMSLTVGARADLDRLIPASTPRLDARGRAERLRQRRDDYLLRLRV